jgi:hypothetical protein
MSKNYFMKVNVKKAVIVLTVFLLGVIVLFPTACFSDSGNFPDHAIETWQKLKKGIDDGYVVNTQSAVQQDDNTPYLKKISRRKNMELVIHNSNRLVCRNKSYSFMLKRNGENDNWTLGNLAQPDSVIESNIAIIPDNADAYEGIMVETNWMETLFQSDNFKILRSEKSVDKDGNEIFIVNFESLFQIDKINQILGGTLYFDPNGYWTLKRYEIKVKCLLQGKELKGIGQFDKDTEGIIKKTFEYQDLDGFPFPKTIITVYESNEFPTETVKTEYSKVTRVVDDNEFYISHYGFAEPPKPPVSYSRFVLIVVGLFLVIVGLLMKFLARKNSKE